ncbi:MAG: DUF6114 domain-containing protein [Thermoplasmata archaeon]
MTESPSAAFGFSIAGGVLIFLAGLILAAIATFVSAVSHNPGILALGWFGCICGILIIAFAAVFHSRPSFTKVGGALVIVFAIIGIPFTFGGFVIGFVLALVGGILAIVWKPTPPTPAIVYATAPPTSGMERHTIERQVVKVRCRYCGNLTDEVAGKCASCGAKL